LCHAHQADTSSQHIWANDAHPTGSETRLGNHKSDYGEERRLIKLEEKFCCAANAEAGWELVMEIAKLLEIPPELFVQQIGGRDNEFVTTYGNIVKVADAYALGNTTGK
jgi:hypothetical protein